MNEKFSTGTTPWVWVTYEALIGSKEENLQVVEWPNGEGITIIRNDETEVHLNWDEWYALKKAMTRLGKENEQKIKINAKRKVKGVHHQRHAPEPRPEVGGAPLGS